MKAKVNFMTQGYGARLYKAGTEIPERVIASLDEETKKRCLGEVPDPPNGETAEQEEERKVRRAKRRQERKERKAETQKED